MSESNILEGFVDRTQYNYRFIAEILEIEKSDSPKFPTYFSSTNNKFKVKAWVDPDPNYTFYPRFAMYRVKEIRCDIEGTIISYVIPEAERVLNTSQELEIRLSSTHFNNGPINIKCFAVFEVKEVPDPVNPPQGGGGEEMPWIEQSTAVYSLAIKPQIYNRALVSVTTVNAVPEPPNYEEVIPWNWPTGYSPSDVAALAATGAVPQFTSMKHILESGATHDKEDLFEKGTDSLYAKSTVFFRFTHGNGNGLWDDNTDHTGWHGFLPVIIKRGTKPMPSMVFLYACKTNPGHTEETNHGLYNSSINVNKAIIGSMHFLMVLLEPSNTNPSVEGYDFEPVYDNGELVSINVTNVIATGKLNQHSNNLLSLLNNGKTIIEALSSANVNYPTRKEGSSELLQSGEVRVSLDLNLLSISPKSDPKARLMKVYKYEDIEANEKLKTDWYKVFWPAN